MSVPASFIFPNWDTENNLFKTIMRELKLSWQFIAGDVSSAIVPALVFMIAACVDRHLNFNEIAQILGCGLIYFWLYLWSFCLSNQFNGIHEDRLNKSSRPIVAGVVSYTGTQLRWIVVMFFFPLLGWYFGVLEWALLWQIVIVLHNIVGLSRHWIGKNFLMSVGIVAQLAAAWQIVSPITPIAWWWILVLAGIIFPLVSVQDLRDISGDRVNFRKTFPIVFGEELTRSLLYFFFIFIPLLLHYALMVTAAARTHNVGNWELGIAAFSIYIAFRIILLRTPIADHHTYLLFTYWYCLVTVSSIFLI